MSVTGNQNPADRDQPGSGERLPPTDAMSDPAARLVSRWGLVYLIVAVSSVALAMLAGILSDEVGYVFLIIGWAVPLSTLPVTQPLSDVITWAPVQSAVDVLRTLPLVFWLIRGPTLLWMGRRARLPLTRLQGASRGILAGIVVISGMSLVGTLLAYADDVARGIDDPVAWIMTSIVAGVEIAFAVLARRALQPERE